MRCIANRRRSGRVLRLAAACAGCWLAAQTTPAYGEIALGFEPQIPGPGHGVLQWSGTGASTLTGDTYKLDTPYQVTGVADSVVTASGTTFNNATLILNGWGANGAAIVQSPIPSMTVLSQPLLPGEFTFQANSATGPQVILKGTATGAVLVGLQGQTSASVQCSNVTYTGGALYDQIVPWGVPTTGSLSWSLMDVSTPGGLQLSAGQLAPFDARLNGIFNSLYTVPEGPPPPPPPSVVYDRSNLMTTNFVGLGPGGTPGRPIPGDHIGNEITLAGTERLLKNATVWIGFGNSTGAGGGGPDTYTLDLYRNDGPGGAPGTKFATSTASAVVTGPPVPVQFGFNTVVPDTFTVVVSSSHRTDTWFTIDGLVGPQSAFASPAVGAGPDSIWFNTDTSATSWVANSTWAIQDGAPTNYFGMKLEAKPFNPPTIIRDNFDRADHVLNLTYPATGTVVDGWYSVQGFAPLAVVKDAHVRLPAGIGLSAPLTSIDDLTVPVPLEISARLQLGDLADDAGDSAFGIGLGFFKKVMQGADIAGDASSLGLVLRPDGRITLAVDGKDTGSSIAYDASLFAGATFDPAAWHALSYQMDPLTGDISHIKLDGVIVGDFTTDLFTEANTPRAGFWASSGVAPAEGAVDDFAVTRVPEPGTMSLLLACFGLLRRRRRAS